MRSLLAVATLSVCFFTGCSVETAQSTSNSPASVESNAGGSGEQMNPTGAANESPAAKAAGSTVALSPQNTKLEFVCAHTGEKPDPRKGTFEKFHGELKIADRALKSLQVEFDTTSIATEFPKLTDHLKSPDFFEVREYPTARFESTVLTTGGTENANSAEGTGTVTGNLTLHGVTKEITIPFSFSVTGEQVKLSAEFTIDRTEFGMNFATDKVEKTVSLTVAVEAPLAAK